MIAELHCHSITKIHPLFPFYESVLSVTEILKICIQKNIRILAITDHNSLKSYRTAKKIIKEQKLPIILVPACEISSKGGHIVAYGITKLIPKGLTAKRTVELIHEQKGLAVAPHPYNEVYSLKDKVFDLELDGIEGYDAYVSDMANQKAMAAAKTMGISIIAGSDAHTASGIGAGRVIFSENLKNWKDVIRAIKNNQIRIEGDRQSRIRFVVDEILGNIRLIFRGEN